MFQVRYFYGTHEIQFAVGGSQMRGLYKDMVWLLNHASMIPNEVLGAKHEKRFPDLDNTEWKVGYSK